MGGEQIVLERNPDPETNGTILSGDIGISGDSTDNSLHVVTGSGTVDTAIIDGFTIANGRADLEDPCEFGCKDPGCTLPCGPLLRTGGGMLNDVGSPTVVNCRFINNRAATGAGMANLNGSRPIVNDSAFTSNETVSVFGEGIGGPGGGVYNSEGSDALFRNCLFLQNSASDGGGIYNEFSSPTVENCSFVGCVVNGEGGGLKNSGASPMILNCLFHANQANAGGAIHNRPGSTCCPFATVNSQPQLVNCTISYNTATVSGSGKGMVTHSFHNLGAPPAIVNLTNCILWGNGPPGFGGLEADQLWNTPGANPIVNNTCVQGWTGSLGGNGNIGANPSFADIDGTDDVLGNLDDDLRLQPGSACIDAGDNTAPALPPHDLADKTRVFDGNDDQAPFVDMGAYEYVALVETTIDAGETQTVVPGGGTPDPDESAMVTLHNTTGPGGASLSVQKVDLALHPQPEGFALFNRTLIVHTSLADGEYFMQVSIPFYASDLNGLDPLTVDLKYWNAIEQTWELAAAGNTQNSPGHPGPVGDRDMVEGTMIPPLSLELGDYGVYWNPTTQIGFVWANVDHTTEFAPVVPVPPPPVLLGDLNCDGAVDLQDAPAFAFLLVDPFLYFENDPFCNPLAGDFNGDQLVDGRDIDGFVDCLSTGNCTP